MKFFLAILLAGVGTIRSEADALDPRPNFQSYEAKNAYDDFAWDLFLYANWPALEGQRGVPDPEGSLSDRGPRLWESWKDLREIMRMDGGPPAPWPVWPQPTFEASDPDAYFRRLGIYTSRIVPLIDGHHLMASNGQHAYLSFRSNKEVFDYIVTRGLYNDQALHAWTADTSAAPMQFPITAMEIKATWVKLSPAEHLQKGERFHVAVIREPETGNAHYFALIGLHVISKVQPNWFWTTFEHVDAQSETTAPKTTDISPETKAVNVRRQAQLKGTCWEFYQLRGSQYSFVDKTNQPVILANTTMETRIQRSSSCMTCHALASEGSATSGTINPIGLGSDGSFGGFVGVPDWMKFCESGFFDTPLVLNAKASHEDFCTSVGLEYRYRSTDYVWIFRLANQLRSKGF